MFLKCRNHPHLRWSCKEMAWTTNSDGSGYYNGCRNIFYFGTYVPDKGMACDTVVLEPECKCPASDLIEA